MNATNATDSDQLELIDEARSINSSLRRVGKSIRMGVMQANSVSTTLDQDGATINNSLHEHKYVLRSALESTNTRLSQLKNAEVVEKYSLLVSLIFFGAVISYVILKRFGLLSVAARSLFPDC